MLFQLAYSAIIVPILLTAGCLVFAWLAQEGHRSFAYCLASVCAALGVFSLLLDNGVDSFIIYMFITPATFLLFILGLIKYRQEQKPKWRLMAAYCLCAWLLTFNVLVLYGRSVGERIVGI